MYFFRTRKPGEGWSPDIFAVRVDGTRLRRLTNGGCEFAPAPSPDGRTLAYTSILSVRDLDCVEGANGSIEAMSTVGRTKALPFRLPDAWTYEPAWAPDSRRLAYFVIDVDSQGEPLESIYISAADGSPPKRVPTPKHASVASPAWSSHGTELALVVRGDIWVAAPDGSELRQVTRGSSDDRAPTWRPPSG